MTDGKSKTLLPKSNNADTLKRNIYLFKKNSWADYLEWIRLGCS